MIVSEYDAALFDKKVFTAESQRSQREAPFFFIAAETPAMKKQLACGS